MSKVVLNYDVSFKLEVLVDQDVCDSFVSDIPEIRKDLIEKFPQYAERATVGDANDLIAIALGLSLSELVGDESNSYQELKVVNMEVKARG